MQMETLDTDASNRIVIDLRSHPYAERNGPHDIHVFLTVHTSSLTSAKGCKVFDWRPTVRFEDRIRGHGPADIFHLIQFMEALDSEISSMC